MISYFIIVIFIILSYFLAKSFSNNPIDTPLYERLDEIDSWKNDILKIDKVDYKNFEIYYCICSKKIFHDYVEEIKICIKNKSDDFFKIKKISILEKILIKFSLLNTLTTTNQNFNSLFYILSDNKKLQALLRKQSIQNNLIETFTAKSPYNHKNMNISNFENEFCINFNYKIYFSLREKYRLKDIDINKIISTYGDYFINLYEGFLLNKQDTLKDINNFKRSLNSIKNLRFIVAFSAVGGFFSMIYNSFIIFPQTIDVFSLLFKSIIPSLGIGILFFYYTFNRLKDSSFKFYMAIKYGFISILSTYLLSMYSMIYLNQYLDKSKEKVFYRTIEDKRKTSKKVTYHLKFNYRYSKTITDDDIRVSSDMYYNKKISDSVAIYIKNGYFNIRYIDKVE